MSRNPQNRSRFRNGASSNKDTDRDRDRIGTAPPRQSPPQPKGRSSVDVKNNSEVVSRVTKEFGFFSHGNSYHTMNPTKRETGSSYKVIKVKGGKKKKDRDNRISIPDDPFPMPTDHFPMPDDDPFPMPKQNSEADVGAAVVGSMTSQMTSIPLPPPDKDLFPMPKGHNSSDSEEEVLLGPAAQWQKQRKIKKGANKPKPATTVGGWESPRSNSTGGDEFFDDYTESVPVGVASGGSIPTHQTFVDSNNSPPQQTTTSLFTNVSHSNAHRRRAANNNTLGGKTGKKKLAPLGLDAKKPSTASPSSSSLSVGVRPGTAAATSPGRSGNSSPKARRHRDNPNASPVNVMPEHFVDYMTGQGQQDYVEDVSSPADTRQDLPKRPSSSRTRSPFVSQPYEMNGYLVRSPSHSYKGSSSSPHHPSTHTPAKSHSSKGASPHSVSSSPGSPVSPRNSPRPSRPASRPGSGRPSASASRQRPGTAAYPSRNSSRSGNRPKTGKNRHKLSRDDPPASPKSSSDTAGSSLGSNSLKLSMGFDNKKKPTRVRSANVNRGPHRNMIVRPPSRQRPPPEALHLDFTGLLNAGASDAGWGRSSNKHTIEEEKMNQFRSKAKDEWDLANTNAISDQDSDSEDIIDISD